jgi:TRAP-type C4-dicarboxylate transport system substrate-binding protein
MFKRVHVLMAVGVIVAFGASAALAHSSKSVATASRLVPLAGETVMLPGSYVTSNFQPSFSFRVDGLNWRAEHEAKDDAYFFYGSPCCVQHARAVTGVLFVMQPALVSDPTRDVLVEAPADLVGWLRHNPHMKVGPVSAVLVAGIRGVQFDAAFRSATKHGDGCANFIPNTAGDFGSFLFCPGDKARLIALTVAGKPIVIAIQTIPGDGLAAFLPKARRLLATLRFEAKPTATAAKPRVLLLGNADPTYGSEIFFARRVAQLSHGNLQIAMHSDLYGGAADNEQKVARDVEHNRLQLAWDPTRVWDKLGITSYQGLQAPFLINSLPLFSRVLRSPVTGEVASGPRKQGVLSLGLTAVNLRRPLGAKKPFLSLADFNGAKMNVIASKLSEQAMKAVGATPVEAGGALHDELRAGHLDGAETAIDVIFENGFGDVAKYVTSNLVFFPKAVTIDVNAAAYRSLTPRQRAILARAARETQQYSITELTKQEAIDAAAICKSGIRFAKATDADIAAIEQAEQPVYDQLQNDPLTGRVVTQIQALKKQFPGSATVSVPAACKG